MLPNGMFCPRHELNLLVICRRAQPLVINSQNKSLVDVFVII